ncbi:MAG: hypothetical protein WCR30_04115 [Clostridia bacterium]
MSSNQFYKGENDMRDFLQENFGENVDYYDENNYANENYENYENENNGKENENPNEGYGKIEDDRNDFDGNEYDNENIENVDDDGEEETIEQPVAEKNEKKQEEKVAMPQMGKKQDGVQEKGSQEKTQPKFGFDHKKRCHVPCIKICKIASTKFAFHCQKVWFRIYVKNFGCIPEKICVVDHLDKCLKFVHGSLTINGRLFRGSIERGIPVCLRPCETIVIQFAVCIEKCCDECCVKNFAEARIEIPCDRCFKIYSNKVCLFIIERKRNCCKF